MENLSGETILSTSSRTLSILTTHNLIYSQLTDVETGGERALASLIYKLCVYATFVM